MSVGFSGLHVLLPALNSIPRSPETKILLLGTQDLAFTYDQAVLFFHRHEVEIKDIPVSERRTTDSFFYVDQRDWWQYKDYLHQETFFRMLGFEKGQIDTLDVNDYEHADVIHDLNQPVSDGFGQYDFILNQGTLEHIFAIQQALWNLTDLTKIGGQIVHMAPANFLGHGFFNFNAELFSDFYRQSNWEQDELFYTIVGSSPDETQPLYGRIDPDKITAAPEGLYMNIFGRFRKTVNSTKPIAVQSIYQYFHADDNIRDRSKAPGRTEERINKPSLRALIKARQKRFWLERRMKRLGVTAIKVDAF